MIGWDHDGVVGGYKGVFGFLMGWKYGGVKYYDEK